MKTKALFIPTVLVFTFFLFPCMGLASAQTTVIRVHPENQTLSFQEDFTVEIVVDPGTAIAGAQFNLRFDSSLMTVASVSEGNLFGQGGANTYFRTPTINNDTGIVVGVAGVVLGPNTVSSSGTFAIIQMRAKSTEGTSALTFEDVKIVDQNGDTVATTSQSGTVTISEIPSDNVPSGGGGISPTALVIGGVVLVVLGIITVYILTRKPEKWEMRPWG